MNTAALGKLALAAAGVVSALGVVELALAVFGVSPERAPWQTRALHRPDSQLVYAMVPGTDHAWTTLEFEERASINSLGLRGPEPAARPGRRILILGDSMTFGQGVRDDETFASLLEERLRAGSSPGSDVEVVNAGVKGYGPDQAVVLFETRLRSLDPVLVVLAVYVNDAGDSANLALFDLVDGRLVPLDASRHPLYREGKLVEALPHFVATTRLGRLLIPRIARLGAFDPRTDLTGPGGDAWVSAKLERLVARLVALGREDGFRVALLGIPSRDGSPDEYGWVRGVAAPFLDLNRLRAWNDDRARFYFAEDPHLNRAGHRRVSVDLQAFTESLELPTPR